MFEIGAIEFAQKALLLVLILSAPPVFVAGAVGLLIALVQAATQIQEQSMQFALKLFCVFVIILFFGAFGGQFLLQFTDAIFSDFYKIVKSA